MDVLPPYTSRNRGIRGNKIQLFHTFCWGENSTFLRLHLLYFLEVYEGKFKLFHTFYWGGNLPIFRLLFLLYFIQVYRGKIKLFHTYCWGGNLTFLRHLLSYSSLGFMGKKRFMGKNEKKKGTKVNDIFLWSSRFFSLIILFLVP